MSSLCAIVLIFMPTVIGITCLILISKKKKVVRCKNCGCQIGANDTFCYRCGAKTGLCKKKREKSDNAKRHTGKDASLVSKSRVAKNFSITKTENVSTNETVNTESPEPITREEHQSTRSLEAEWLENHYDLNSVEGIKRIPAKKGLRCPETSGITGQLYYYLRHKSYEYEKEGEMDLAVACMSKSSELAMLDYGSMIQKQELYPLIRILARNGQVDEAISKKEYVDRYCQEQRDKLDKGGFYRVVTDAKKLGTDLVIMDVLGTTCTECAKYQGRVYSLSGNSKKYPKLPDFFYRTGRVHPGCGHTFSSFIDGVDDPMMEYTLSVHPLKNRSYGRNIVAFSNRPFIDDRTEAAKAQANAYIAEQEAKRDQERQNDDNMIEYEVKRGNDMRDFFWLRENIPQKCPKSATGYRRMKTQNTKNYQILKQLAAELGREI